MVPSKTPRFAHDAPPWTSRIGVPQRLNGGPFLPQVSTYLRRYPPQGVVHLRGGCPWGHPDGLCCPWFPKGEPFFVEAIKKETDKKSPIEEV